MTKLTQFYVNVKPLADEPKSCHQAIKANTMAAAEIHTAKTGYFLHILQFMIQMLRF